MALALGSTPASAQEETCTTARISHIFVDNHSIFDTSDPDDETPFLWARRIANRIHRRTRASFIRDELLLDVGDCIDALLLFESERILRDHNFIAEADVFAIDQGDGTAHLLVDTRDEWTTKFDMRFDLDQGFRITQIGLQEENFLGTGNLLGFFLRERDERRDAGLDLGMPRLMGTRLDGRLSVGQTRTGAFFDQSIAYPFVGEVGRFAGIQSFSRRDDLFRYAAPGSAPFRNVVVPWEKRRWELTGALRFGSPGALSIVGLGFSRDDVDTGYPDRVKVVVNDNFAQREPADSATSAALASQMNPRITNRLNVLLGLRRIRFISRRGLDAITGQQDIRVGSQFLMTLGTTLGNPFEASNEADELWTRFSLFLGTARDRWVFNSEAKLESTRVFRSDGQAGEFRDVIGEFDAYFYWQPRSAANHTFVGRLSGAGGWDSSYPFQLTLGGKEALRGFDVEDFPGAARLLFTFEDRIRMDGVLGDLADFGVTLFADAGTMWAGDVPFGADSGFRSSVGAGIRLGFPRGTRNIIRVDLAVPLERGGLRNLQLRMRMSELVSLLRGFDDPQVQRSRGIGINPSIFGTPRVR